MNADSFWESFGHSKPRLLKKSAGCIAANGSKMDSMGIYEIERTIRLRKFLHPVTVVEELNDNILGIDFMHQHKLNYDATSKQITFAHVNQCTVRRKRGYDSCPIIYDGKYKIQRTY